MPLEVRGLVSSAHSIAIRSLRSPRCRELGPSPRAPSAAAEHHEKVTDGVRYREVGDAAAPALALLWARAEAHRRGEPMPATVDESAVDALRARLAEEGATAVLGVAGDEPVAGCFATQACLKDTTITGRAHVSGISVDPQRWGQGLARGALRHLEEALVTAGYDAVQLHVLETNARARSLYEHLGWRLGELARDPAYDLELAHPLRSHVRGSRWRR